MRNRKEEAMKSMDDFLEVMRLLRQKCPWDSVQTHESLKPYLLDEAQEVLEGIDILSAGGSSENLCEELGDVLMHVVLHSLIAEEEGLFTLDDVIKGAAAKMRFRHPHIFAPDDEELGSMTWEELKTREKELREKP
jgi:tetrapyrrole methylase family protein/MazG family protein